MNTIPDIYIAAIISNLLSLSIFGGVLMYLTPREERIFIGLLIVLMLPMNPLAYYVVRMPIDSLLSNVIGKESQIYGFIRNFYAPLTEEPAKLWPLLIPLFYRRINSSNLVRIAIAIGLGFGVGEAWTVATLMSKSPEIAAYPWYMLGGYIFERFMVCIAHAAFVAVAIHFIVIRRAVISGVLLGALLHFLGNFPIYLARNNMFGLGKDVWQGLLILWTNSYFLAMGAILAYMAYGKGWFKKDDKRHYKVSRMRQFLPPPFFYNTASS